MSVAVRPAAFDDLPAINAIYNYFVRCSTCTWQLEPNTEEERRAWFIQHPVDLYPAIVAVDERQAVVGWGSLSTFHGRAGYRFTVENSVYVDVAHHRRGIGRVILADLLARADTLGYRNVIAVISADQTASIALHRQFGFVDAGLLRGVGSKFDRWLDVLYMQRTSPARVRP